MQIKRLSRIEALFLKTLHCCFLTICLVACSTSNDRVTQDYIIPTNVAGHTIQFSSDLGRPERFYHNDDGTFTRTRWGKHFTRDKFTDVYSTGKWKQDGNEICYEEDVKFHGWKYSVKYLVGSAYRNLMNVDHLGCIQAYQENGVPVLDRIWEKLSPYYNESKNTANGQPFTVVKGDIENSEAAAKDAFEKKRALKFEALKSLGGIMAPMVEHHVNSIRACNQWAIENGLKNAEYSLGTCRAER